MVYYYHKLVNKDNLKTVCLECKNGSRGCVACKKELINKMQEFLKPIREKRKYYEQNSDVVDDILKEGTLKAQNYAKKKMKLVRKNMKIDYFE